MRFKLDTIYTDELPVAFGCVSQKRLAQTLRDGRAAAFLVFEHLLGRFSDLKRNRDPDYPRDCIAKGDYVFQVRMVTANGTALNPHKQNGTRRKFDKLEYQYARQLLDGFLLVDVTAAPRITYAFVPENDVPRDAKYNYADARGLINSAPWNGKRLPGELTDC
jgi:hypothetical protein